MERGPVHSVSVKRRTRARWSRTAAAARWTLTLLLVALVGVTVASGRWALHWQRVTHDRTGAAQRLQLLLVEHGSITWFSADYSVINPPVPLRSKWLVRRHPPPGEPFAPTTPKPFNLWRVRSNPNGWSVSLTYPVIVVTLPTLFLWYSRIFRCYGRGHCQRCGYDLAGLAAVEERIVCPECGASNTAARNVKRGLPGDPSPGAENAVQD